MFALCLALAVAAPPPVPAVPFVVVGIAEERPTGKLIRLTPDLFATLATRTGETTVKDVLSLRRENRPLPTFPTGPQLLTTTGDRIAGKLLGGGKQSLRFLPSIGAGKESDPWLVPFSLTSAVWLADMPADTPLDPARYTWTEGNKNRDVFRLRNGDTARGILIDLGPEAVHPAIQFRPEMGEPRTIPGRELAAIAFNPALAKSRKPKGPFLHVVFTNGSRLDLANSAIADGILKGETLFGQRVELPLDEVLALDVFQGKAVYLSDLKPKKVEQAAFLGVTWPWVSDRTVHGTQLKLVTATGDSTFDKGLGMHPKTVLTYDLGGKYRWFESCVGLDSDSGDHARVIVRVRVDGKEQPIAKLGANAVALRVDVTGAKELVLEVDFGPAGSVRGDVNWGDARLIE